ncbi:aminoglycoside 3'-phosphotransferase [Microbacterium sp. M3]|uniref:Aminoglycoside 3'-phosphotransferase n=1 Tax=Microbacterium arthrosphaerae TaxID=792652 RepID=A0ABU4GYJ1_9MICO|nr:MULTISPECIES: aminoglycoside 3'-phosphotransferase [Microbacterium]MDW4572151.1 aminoglycoside 3'-phosphotransferase [Microbacterium arthrosphaerae]MDW7606006.1 aminoglycoside 3'-phosphotransferase [Microbacterium sp. M3]
MSIPVSDVAVPEPVRALARGATLTPVWRNDYGGVTFAADDGRYIKHGPRNAESTFAGEAARLAWAAPFARVPVVLEVGGDETHEWMATAALPGSSAVDRRWITDAATAVRAVGEGLRALHDTLPVDACPFDWGVPGRIANAAGRGIRVPDALRDPPPIDRLVVCHGDACCPNTLVGDDGRWSGHVDLGTLGVADRWADIAVASMSTAWNYGEGWEDALIEAYGVEPDRERLSYYRDLWNAT